MPAPDLVNVVEPDTTPVTVPVVLVATCTVAAADNATAFDKVPAALKYTAPADDTPVPAIVNGSFTVPVVATSSVPAVTVVAASDPLNAPAAVIFKVPYATDVAPV